MKQDIQSNEDIELLVKSFYTKAREDEVIGYIFNEVVQIHWEKHIPKITGFWGHLLFQNGAYKGNVTIKHLELNQLEPLKKVHFERWIKIWQETVSEHFIGEKATEAVEKATLLKNLMMYKTAASQDKNFIQ